MFAKTLAAFTAALSVVVACAANAQQGVAAAPVAASTPAPDSLVGKMCNGYLKQIGPYQSPLAFQFGFQNEQVKVRWSRNPNAETTQAALDRLDYIDDPTSASVSQKGSQVVVKFQFTNRAWGATVSMTRVNAIEFKADAQSDSGAVYFGSFFCK